MTTAAAGQSVWRFQARMYVRLTADADRAETFSGGWRVSVEKIALEGLRSAEELDVVFRELFWAQWAYQGAASHDLHFQILTQIVETDIAAISACSYDRSSWEWAEWVVLEADHASSGLCRLVHCDLFFFGAT